VSLRLFEHGHHLAIGKARDFHRISFKSNSLEILLLSQVKGRGITISKMISPRDLYPENFFNMHLLQIDIFLFQPLHAD